jgi:hypothetical protein
MFTVFELINVDHLLDGLYYDMRAESQNSGARRDIHC